jgi:hypothetical protein
VGQSVRAIDQYDQVIDLLLAKQRDAPALRAACQCDIVTPWA